MTTSAPHLPAEHDTEGFSSFRKKLHIIIFWSTGPAGKAFDVILILAILLSVTAVMAESISSVREQYGDLLYAAEWFFTILFTIEYALRIYCSRHRWHYIRSFYGVVDLLAIIPTYVSAFLPGAQFLLVIRLLRILRVFRVLKLATYLDEASQLANALRASRRKIAIFIFTVLTLVVILGSLMYLVEGEENGFTSIPRSVYWAIVTLTTVGYGDISPQTNLGQTLASLIMILGYGIIAVPTSIVTVELARAEQAAGRHVRQCPTCSRAGHDVDATFCKYCGSALQVG